jgi:hypothetical protein
VRSSEFPEALVVALAAAADDHLKMERMNLYSL